jgi:hypothetical protein
MGLTIVKLSLKFWVMHGGVLVMNGIPLPFVLALSAIAIAVISGNIRQYTSIFFDSLGLYV